MACCTCCCPDGEECCKAPGPDGICCDPERCCGTEEEPVCCNDGDTCCGEGSEATCCPEDEYCCEGICQEEPCEEGTPCTNDGDCEYEVLGVSIGDPGCPEDTFGLYYFATFEEAFAYGSALPEACGPLTIVPAYGKCCNNECYPAYDSLPFGTNEDPLSCP